MKLSLTYQEVREIVISILAIASNFGADITTIEGLVDALENNGDNTITIDTDLEDDAKPDNEGE